MAQKASPTKKAATTAKKSPSKPTKGQSYACEVCGLAVTVVEDCECTDSCEIICCGQEMKPKASARTNAVAPRKRSVAKK